MSSLDENMTWFRDTSAVCSEYEEHRKKRA
jgi:hypothetical protein